MINLRGGTMAPAKYLRFTVLLLLQLLSQGAQHSIAEEATNKPPEVKASNCNIFKYVGANDLSVNDIVVKSVTGNLACIKARFSLAIKVEAAFENTLSTSENPLDKILDSQNIYGDNKNDEGTKTELTNNVDGHDDVELNSSTRMLLGYLPLDTVTSVEDSCPDAVPGSVPKEGHQAEKGGRLILSEPRDLEMIVSFECGKLAFSFRRDDNNFYVSAIRGVVNLDSSTMREFSAEQPMLYTSDLTHHFKFNDLIEVNSTAKSKAFILTANFYNLEFETFRNTTSRSFIRPADEKSQIFLN